MIYDSLGNARSFMQIHTIHWKGNRVEFGLSKFNFYDVIVGKTENVK